MAEKDTYAPKIGGGPERRVIFCKGCYEMERTIEVDLGCFVAGFKMTIDVPENRDAEEYIDEYLDTILNINLRYNCDWVFVK